MHSVPVVSTTLTGNSAGIIGDALASVIDQVDACLVIDTGVSDATINVAMRICGPKLILRRWPWRNDFAAARNAALAFAAGVGADWALTLDPDERMQFDPGFSLRTYLDALPADCLSVMAHYQGDRYMKERVLRPHRDVCWVGLTHECTKDHPGRREVAKAFKFWELDKDAETDRRKNERDVLLLREQCHLDPLEPRWPLYLGRALHNLRRPEEALNPLRQALRLSDWDNDGVMAAFRLVQCHMALGEPAAALLVCEEGIERRPDVAEFQFMRDVANSKRRAA